MLESLKKDKAQLAMEEEDRKGIEKTSLKLMNSLLSIVTYVKPEQTAMVRNLKQNQKGMMADLSKFDSS